MSTNSSAEMMNMPPPTYVERPARNKAFGMMTRVSRNRISCSFVIEGYQMMFDATLNPAMPPFTSKSATIFFEDAEYLTGTYSFNGYIGPSNYEITIVNNGRTIAELLGDLNVPHLDSKHQVHGSGSWMST